MVRFRYLQKCHDVYCTERWLSAIRGAVLDAVGDARCNIPELVGRPDVVLLVSAKASEVRAQQLIDDRAGRHGVQIFDCNMERGSPGDQRSGHSDQVAMGIDQSVESGR